MNREALRESASRLLPGLLMVGLVLLAVVPRFVSLGSRPVIHDESMFAYYSFIFQQRGHFVHMPLLHGPTLILLTGTVFRFFGDSMEVARAFIACCSLVALAACLPLVPRRCRLWLAPLLLTSPLLLYFSRFMRNEMLFNAVLMPGMLLVILSLSARHWRPGLRALCGGVGLAALLSLAGIKENALFVYATGVTFGGVWAVAHWLRRRTSRAGERADGAEDEADDPQATRTRRRTGLTLAAGFAGGALLGVAIVAGIYGVTLPRPHHAEVLHSVVGDDPKLVSDVMSGRETLPLWSRARVLSQLMGRSPANMQASLDYWTGQHTQQRIAGPLHYHLPVLLTYELPILLLLLIGILWEARSASWKPAVYGAGYLLWFVLWLIWILVDDSNAFGPLESVQEFLHIGPTSSMMTLGLILTPMLVWTLLALGQGRVLAAWTGWWTACSLFQYSSAGEKVPWLAVHILLPLYLMLVWVWVPRLQEFGPRGRRVAVVVVALVCVVALRNDFYLIGARSADPRERIVYNHTTPWIHEFIEHRLAVWQEDDAEGRIPLRQRKVMLVGAAGWPGTWYFRRCRYKLVGRKNPPKQVDQDVELVIGDANIIRPLLDDERWIATRGSLRDHWWAPWPEAEGWWARRKSTRPPRGQLLGSTSGLLWDYYWNRESWTAPGGFPLIALESRRRR